MARRFDQANFVAIRTQVDAGHRIKEKLPGVARAYCRGDTLRSIVEQFSIVEKFDLLSEDQAVNALEYALKGHSGGFEIEAYEGLIPKEDQASLRKKRKKEFGKRSLMNRYGVHAFSKYEKKRFASEGGRKAYRDGVGVHGLSEEKKRAAGRNGGLAAAIKRGEIPWSERVDIFARDVFVSCYLVDEKEAAYRIGLEERFKRSVEPRKGLPDNPAIKNEINNLYHDGMPVRSVNAISIERKRYERKLKS
ncbi:hypothetical protein COV18_05330 [Candidatus Woesearchaeota archaeon CG10_big_fil_rev_8_21_14_0_10_37_12]|nr:MAG: hypothetical protein COV18_05330 [Candidatus Woesearchaeota archaeon CG10_big_fil_rev_8_21_14_0_10_37_12]